MASICSQNSVYYQQRGQPDFQLPASLTGPDSADNEGKKEGCLLVQKGGCRDHAFDSPSKWAGFFHVPIVVRRETAICLKIPDQIKLIWIPPAAESKKTKTRKVSGPTESPVRSLKPTNTPTSKTQPQPSSEWYVLFRMASAWGYLSPQWLEGLFGTRGEQVPARARARTVPVRAISAIRDVGLQR